MKNMENHPTTFQSDISAIRPLDEWCGGGVRDNGSPPTFHVRLRGLIAASGRSLLSIARAAGLHHSTLQTWAAGTRHPGVASLGRLGTLERVLGAPAGALTSLVSRWPGRLDTGLTEHRRYLGARLRERYLHRLREWCPPAREEWTDLSFV